MDSSAVHLRLPRIGSLQRNDYFDISIIEYYAKSLSIIFRKNIIFLIFINFLTELPTTTRSTSFKASLRPMVLFSFWSEGDVSVQKPHRGAEHFTNLLQIKKENSFPFSLLNFNFLRRIQKRYQRSVFFRFKFHKDMDDFGCLSLRDKVPSPHAVKNTRSFHPVNRFFGIVADLSIVAKGLPSASGSAISMASA